jgi:hypothetical protein
MNYKSAVAGLLCLGAVGCQKETVVRVVPMEYEQAPRTVYTTQTSYAQPIRYVQPRQTVYTTSYAPAVQTVVAPAPVVYGSRPVIVYDNPYRYNNVYYRGYNNGLRHAYRYNRCYDYYPRNWGHHHHRHYHNGWHGPRHHHGGHGRCW